MNLLLLRSLVIVVGVGVIASMISPQPVTSTEQTDLVTGSEVPAGINPGTLHQVAWSPQVGLPDLIKNPLTHSDMDKASALAGSVKASEWLGPLAPIAISPFFGVTLLAGLAQFGNDWMPVNEFLSNNAVLKNPAVFWVFLILTVLTSVPRFTKVSKAAAQAIDQVEAYAGIITIILLRVMMIPEAGSPAEVPVVLQAGVFSMTADTLMCVAAVINIVVINTVKFFFEVSVWLIPFPFVDALLEVGNKTACVALMAVYAYSPLIATIINLVIFTACLIAFRWIYRRTVYLRTILFDPVLAIVWPGYGTPKKKRLTVFNKEPLAPFPAKSRLVLSVEDSGWKLTEQRILFQGKSIPIDAASNPMIHKGMLSNHLEFCDQSDGDHQNPNHLVFSRRYSGELAKLAELLRIPVATEIAQPDVRTGDLHTA